MHTESLCIKSGSSLVSCGERGGCLALRGNRYKHSVEKWQECVVLDKAEKIQRFLSLLYAKHLFSAHATQKYKIVYIVSKPRNLGRRTNIPQAKQLEFLSTEQAV